MKQGVGGSGFCFLSRDDRKSSQGYVDLKRLTIEELDELIARQSKLLQNRSFLEKLPDNGKKILFFKTELETERKKKEQEYDKTCQLMFNLSLNDKNTEQLEWNQEKLNLGKKQFEIATAATTTAAAAADDDDDDDDDGIEVEEKESRKNESDLLMLVATHSGTAIGKNMKINSLKSKTCNTSLKDSKKSSYTDKFCEKYGNLNTHEERFKPNQLKNNDKTLFVSSAEQIRKRLGNKWEITEATPPVPVYKNAMMISLTESLILLKEQAKKLKEIEQKHATEKLFQNMSLKMGDKVCLNNITEYRNTRNSFDEVEVDESVNDESEFSDSDSEDKKNTVCFLLDDNR